MVSYNYYLRIFYVLIFLILIVLEYYRDHYIINIKNVNVSNRRYVIKAGDILRVGIRPDGYVSSYWVGGIPVHHYILVVDIENILYVIHTWTYKVKGNVVHIKPNYYIQPLIDYINKSKMKFLIIYRHDELTHYNYRMDHIKSTLLRYQTSCRCYILVLLLLQDLYRNQQHMLFPKYSDQMGYTFFLYSPKMFEQDILNYGYKIIPNTNCVLLLS